MPVRDPIQEAKYAALAEQVYRRAVGTDQELSDQVIFGQTLPDVEILRTGPFLQAQKNGYFYSSTGNEDGFVARVVQDTPGHYIIAFRGTDAGNFSASTLFTGVWDFLRNNPVGSPGSYTPGDTNYRYGGMISIV